MRVLAAGGTKIDNTISVEPGEISMLEVAI
ncbi:hypothetical protein ACFV4K_01145 [Nocardia sp. NPDC059764]